MDEHSEDAKAEEDAARLPVCSFCRQIEQK